MRVDEVQVLAQISSNNFGTGAGIDPDLTSNLDFAGSFEKCFMMHVARDAEDFSDKFYLTEARHAERVRGRCLNIATRLACYEQRLCLACFESWRRSKLSVSIHCLAPPSCILSFGGAQAHLSAEF